MASTSARETLLANLEQDGDSYFGAGTQNNIIDLSLTITVVLASLVATVLATTAASRWIVAAVAAIPAAAASLQRIVGIRERSNWYFLCAAEVRALATRLKYAAAPNLEDFAFKRAELEVQMEKEWLKIGHSGATPSTRTAQPRAPRTPKKKPSP